MPMKRDYVWRAEVVGILACLALFTGCTWDEPVAEEMDTAYITTVSRSVKVSVGTTFARFRILEADEAEEIWATLETPDEKTLSLWTANGLRVAWARGEEARKARKAFASLATFKSKRREISMPSRRSFDTQVGALPGGALVYETASAKVLVDTLGGQLMLEVVLTGGADKPRMHLLPYLKWGQGPDGRRVNLDGLPVVVSIESNEIVLVSAVREAPPRTLGRVLLDEASGEVRMIIIEPRTGR